MKINGNLVFNGNATGEIQNAYIERLAAAPVFNAAHKGRLYFNTTTALFYYNDGSAWVPFATGGNAAGTEVIGTGYSVAANSAFDWYGMLRLDVADFLVGGASAATSLTFEAEGEIGVAG